MTEVLFKDDIVRNKLSKTVLFHDLNVMECFVVVSPASKNAVYMKVQDRSGCNGYHYKQLELATGFLFNPTISPVRRVDVRVEIDVNRPEIYKEDIPF